ncbi:MAG: cytochrome c1 [Pseudomonadota bacterium]
MKPLKLIATVAASAALASSAMAAGGAEHAHPPEEGWAFEGAFGEFDEGSLQRGYQVYREVCASCHSMKLMSYRNLSERGGPFYSADYPANENPLVKAFAAEAEIFKGYDEYGDEVYGPATAADRFPSPFSNENAARAANGGALPPDLSVITKARHGGASYVYSLLSGYPDWEEVDLDGNITFPRETSHGSSHGDGDHGGEESHDGEDAHHGDSHDEPHGLLAQPIGQYYNPYFPGDTTPQWTGDPRHIPAGGFLAMAPPLADGQVTYLDGTEATVEQMAADVAHFLAWAGEPKQEIRKSTGLKTIIFLTVFAILLWLSYHQIWEKVEH